VSNQSGTLFIVATPIGNLGDMSQRAQETLQAVDLIAAEDTRHSKKLLQHFGINTPCQAYHEHNERETAGQLLTRLQNGDSIAVISDAGTPLISDPGFHLVNLAQQADIKVVPIPGSSAILAALATAGLPTDRFIFEGFLSSKQQARQKQLQSLANETRTLVLYESPHRILACLEDMLEILGADRQVVLARELTKAYETVHRETLTGLVDWVKQDKNQQRGEIVLVVAGADEPDPSQIDTESEQVLKILLEYLPVKQAASATASITGVKKNKLYARALEIKPGT